MVVTLPALAKECGQLDWTYEDSRTQAGGWVWFPGRSENKSLSLATLEAEGRSLEYLKGECGIIPAETKFHERCVEEVEGGYRVHVRASIKQMYCNTRSEKSAELTKRHLNYQSMVARAQVNYGLCNEQHPQSCFIQADKEWRMKNISLAIAYADLACQYGDTFSCGFLGFLHFELGNAFEAKKHLSYACNRSIENSCKVLKDLESQLKRI